MQVLTTGPFLKGELIKTRIRSPWFFLIMLLGSCGLYVLGRSFEHAITETIIPFFPYEKDKGFIFYRDFVRLCLNEMLWLSFFCLIAWWLVAVPGRLRKAYFTLSISHAQAAIVVGVFFCITLCVSWFALETFPNSSDEYAYLIQAEMLGEGKLSEHVPTYSDAFHYNHIAVKDGVRVGRFPPGWPLFLSIANMFEIPVWIINPIVGAISLLLFYIFVYRFYNPHVALWSLAIVGLSSYFIFNAASYFSHVSCFLAILGFVWFFKLSGKRNTIQFLVAAGFCLGLVSIIRYYTAVLIAVPFLGYAIYHYRFRSVKIVLALAVGALPWTMFLLWYNYSLTGNAFTPVTVWAYTDEQLGFVKGHTVIKGLEHIVRRLFMFMYWCSPGVLILYFIFLWRKLRTSIERWTHPEDYVFVVLLLGHFVYYQIGGNQYGPRFLLEAFPFVAVFIARTIMEIRFSAGYAALLIAGLVFSVIKFPLIVSREAEIVDERQDLYDLVESRGVENAVVIIESPTSPLRPMPVGDLTRNGNDLNSSVLYVQNVPETADVLRGYQSTRSFYRYVRDTDQIHGKLIRIDALQSGKEQ